MSIISYRARRWVYIFFVPRLAPVKPSGIKDGFISYRSGYEHFGDVERADHECNSA